MWCWRVLAMAALSSASLNVPAWDWEPTAPVSACINVADSDGLYGNRSVRWTNNSRRVYIAEPAGAPPPGGWPVLMNLLTVDYGDAYGGGPCGLDGANSPSMTTPPAACVAHAKAACAAAGKSTAQYAVCASCVSKMVRSGQASNATGPCAQPRGQVSEGWRSDILLADVCAAAPPLAASCVASLAPSCGVPRPQNTTPSRSTYLAHRACRKCVSEATRKANPGRHEKNATTGKNGCPLHWQSAEVNLFCGPEGTNRENNMPGNVRSFKPFDSPQSMGMQCSCINGSGDFFGNFLPNGTKVSCGRPTDDGHDGDGYVPAGLYCDNDVFFGGMWGQQLKQYCLQNGIAVMDVNNYVRDGWESYASVATGGYDAVFFDALSTALAAHPALANLNARKLAVRGWSGGAQEVSWLIDQQAKRMKPWGSGLVMRAGVLMAGGSMQCYDEPPFARGQCANCTTHVDQGHYNRSNASVWGNSCTMAKLKLRPVCKFCCPDGVTEDHYR